MASGRFWQYFSTIIVCIGSLHLGIILGWSSPFTPMIKQDRVPMNVSYDETNWIVSIAPLAAMFSSMYAGIVADAIGRRYTIMMTAMPSLVCWLLIMIYPTVIVLLCCRFILGMAMGISGTIIPIYIGEIAETEIRGMMCTLFQAFLWSGEIIMFAGGFFKSYRLLQMPGMIACVLLQLGTCFIPESPPFLIETDEEKAKQSLTKLRGPSYDITKELNEIRKESEIQSSSPPLLTVLNRKSNRKALTLGIVLMALQQMTGINAVIFYTEELFIQAAPTLPSTLCTVGVSLIALATTIVSGFFVDKTGRKTMLIISGIGTTFFTGALGLHFHFKESQNNFPTWVAIVWILGFFVSFAIGWGPVPWILLAELFAMGIKRFASGAAVASSFGFAFLTTFAFRVSVNYLGICPTFIFVAVFGTFSLLIVIIFVPETKNKTLKQIQAELSR